MDIIKQISILLWLLGAILITPPVLRHFHIDVKDAYRKVLMLENKETKQPDGLAPQKKEIDPHVFDELFQEVQPETPAQCQKAEKEVKNLISGLDRVSHVASSGEHQISGVPSLFHMEKTMDKKVPWLPPPAGFMTAETFNYLIYRQSKPVGEKLKTVLDTIHGNLMLDLTPFTIISKPNKILVMLFGEQESYMTFTKRPSWSGAASDLRADTMYVLEGASFYPLSVHELTHLYFDGYFLPAISPLWLSEGMAVYMQIYATKQKPSWIDNSLRNILMGKYISLEGMMQMTDLSGLTTGQAELWYTQAYSLIDYLLNERSRDEFYRFCNELKAGTPVHQALYRAYGMPFTKISVLQNVWLHDLAKHSQGHLLANQSPNKYLPKEVISSTQTVSVPAPAVPPPHRMPAQPPKKTVVPKLQMVETNGYKGNF